MAGMAGSSEEFATSFPRRNVARGNQNFWNYDLRPKQLNSGEKNKPESHMFLIIILMNGVYHWMKTVYSVITGLGALCSAVQILAFASSRLEIFFFFFDKQNK